MPARNAQDRLVRTRVELPRHFRPRRVGDPAASGTVSRFSATPSAIAAKVLDPRLRGDDKKEQVWRGCPLKNYA